MKTTEVKQLETKELVEKIENAEAARKDEAEPSDYST